MECHTPFAQMPTTPEPIIAQVQRHLAEDDRFARQVPRGVLERVADRAVRELWSRPVKTFVPILALRQAQEILREQDLVIPAQRTEACYGEGARTAAWPPVEQRRGAGLFLDGDVLPHDEGDLLRL
jgi:hypothetical protein